MKNSSLSRLLCLCGGVLLTVSSAFSSVVGQGEFQVNTTALSNYEALNSAGGAVPDIAPLKDGGFVITWDNNTLAGANYNWDVFAQRYDANGFTVGGEFLVSGDLANDQYYPSVAGLVSGGFVIVWTDFTGRQAAGQIYNASGVPVGSKFSVGPAASSAGNGYDSLPEVVARPDGGFTVTWYGVCGGSTSAVCGRTYSAAGVGGATFKISSGVYTFYAYESPDVVMLNNGKFVVTWEASDRNLYSRIMNADGTPFTPSDNKVSLFHTVREGYGIAALDNGGYVITWAGTAGVYSQRYDANGVAAGSEITVYSDITKSYFNIVSGFTARVSSLNSGGFISGWSMRPSVGLYQPYVKIYDATGVAQGSETSLAVSSTSNLGNISLATLNSGQVVAAWVSSVGNYSTGIYAQRFVIDGEPTATPAPTVTPAPTATPVPTSTPVPTNTPTPVPTDTPIPTDTPTPVPTDTPTPVPTDTPTPAPTDTPTAVPTLTPTPSPTLAPNVLVGGTFKIEAGVRNVKSAAVLITGSDGAVCTKTNAAYTCTLSAGSGKVVVSKYSTGIKTNLDNKVCASVIAPAGVVSGSGSSEATAYVFSELSTNQAVNFIIKNQTAACGAGYQ